MALTAKQACFVQEYLIDLNATQAAIRAGYSKKTAYAVGHENLSKPEIADAIAEAQAERATRTQITQDRVLQELAKVGFSDIRGALTPNGQLLSAQEWDDQFAGAVSSLEVVQRPSGEYDDDGKPIMENVSKFRMWDKMNALEKMGKHLGMFKEETTVTHKVEPFTGFEIEDAAKPD
jgi:phage terminase small subunit